MTWRPEPQPPCTEPCCTGGDLRSEEYWPIPGWGQPIRVDAPPLRVCGIAVCTSCPTLTEWVEDAAPVEAPPEPASALARTEFGETRQPPPYALVHMGDMHLRWSPRPPWWRRILNAARRAT